MRGLMVFIVCLIFVFSVSTTYAAPVGNIATPAVLKKGLVIPEQEGQYGIIAGSENDIIFDHRFKNQDGDTEFNFFGGKLGVMFADRFIVYTILGAGQAEQKFTISGTKVKWETDYDLVWGVGGTAMLYETTLEQLGNGTLRLGIDGRYRQAQLDVDKIIVDSTSYDLPNSAVTSTKYELGEWQVALAISYQIEKIIPYVGVKYSDVADEAKTTVSGTNYKIEFDQDDNVGIFVGGDLLATDSILVNVEGRFIDETALTVAATIRF